jgi:hypothetical protein
MGTNFYRVDPTGRRGRGSESGPEWHLGKRSAAGWWCWDCGVTLCRGGTAGVHHDRYGWHDRCPMCGQEPQKLELTQSAAGLELGFTDSIVRTGVSSCCSFTWNRQAEHRDWLELEWLSNPYEPVVEDEYGRRITARAFLDLVAECPIQYESAYDYWS